MDPKCKNMCLCVTCEDKLCAKYHCQDCKRYGKVEWHVEECTWTNKRLKDNLNKKHKVEY